GTPQLYPQRAETTGLCRFGPVFRKAGPKRRSVCYFYKTDVLPVFTRPRRFTGQTLAARKPAFHYLKLFLHVLLSIARLGGQQGQPEGPIGDGAVPAGAP